MSSKSKNADYNKAHRSEISRQLLIQYVLTVIGYVASIIVIIILAQTFCSMFVWHEDDWLYRILSWFKENIIYWGGFLSLIGCIAITYRYISKPLHYLDEIIAASKHLAKPTDEQIELPAQIKNVQDELNLIREQALRNAALAKEAEQRKNDLIVYLAHDLKTPLTSVIGYLTLLRDEPQISQELRVKYTGIALNKAERLEELINEFFDITRFNLTSISLELEKINLTRMIEQITFEFNLILENKGLMWTKQFAQDIEVVCDPDKLERVIDNLIRNAVNYSYPDTEINVLLEQTDKSAVLKIKNKGKTISEEKLGRIFEQFFRLDSSRGTSTGGSGLGLAIAKEIVELHGGTIKAESADESILFTVELPLDCQKIV